MQMTSQAFEKIEAQAFRWQQSAFCVFTIFVTAALLVLHTVFSSLLGKPSAAILLLLCVGIVGKVAELFWLWQQKDGISRHVAGLSTVLSMTWLFGLSAVLAVLTDRDDAPYFVLLSIPILQCAYRFGLASTVFTIAAAIAMIFGWAEHFFMLHPPARPTEFLEAGMISVIYSLMGILVWYLVNQLGRKEARLFEKMAELEVAREKLTREEKLAAVGRLASGIAHEIRNPVAMISSSLTTALYPHADPQEREEMFALAAREAKRLELLTADFLSYARPSQPQRALVPIAEILQHVLQLMRVRGAEKSVRVELGKVDSCQVEVDPFQVEGALVNLAMNAIDATPPKGRATLSTRVDSDVLFIDVEDSGRSIREEHLAFIFEPFFTTKRSGTGLGLAISRSVARTHGGDLWVSCNEEGAVRFTMSLCTRVAAEEVRD